MTEFHDMPEHELAPLLAQATALALRGHGRRITYSRKVFVPLTRLCRDVCHYCTFATTPSQLDQLYLSPDQVLELARQGEAAGCHELLFTLGDKPELRYAQAAEALKALGYTSTVAYLQAMCELVLAKTRLLPHVNAGIMTDDELASLRDVSASQGIMLESTAERLCQRGGVHFGSPDKHPAVRLAMIEAAGRLRIPFTTGILIGIGETRDERLQALRAIADLQQRHGHIQEVIIQNFRAKTGTKMSDADEPGLNDLLWTIAQARLILGERMNIQAPPNLTPGVFAQLLSAGLNDWGGISPVTPDHVNPEAPWPHVADLARATAERGYHLVPRLAIYPEYCREPGTWLSPRLHGPVCAVSDTEGLARTDDWAPGSARAIPQEYAAQEYAVEASAAPTIRPAATLLTAEIDAAIKMALAGHRLDEQAIVTLFSARGADEAAVLQAADALRQAVAGDTVSYVVNRNLNYTNLCTLSCGFCAFSKSQGKNDLRGAPYDLDDSEIARRVTEAWQRGATEVCMQGGIHPGYTGEKYLALARLVKATQPAMHVHAFSPLEVAHGAQTLDISLTEFLTELKRAGLDTLPGTAAEILDDEIRALICPDKIDTATWLEVMRAAHRVGLRSTATIMFGHVDRYVNWARHLLRIRDLQQETGGFTEFVPLPFIYMEAPMTRHLATRPGPTFRETLLMHAVARLVLHPLIPNIQTSWVKLGPDGAAAALRAGANDLGGTLMNESISRAAGAAFGEEMSPERMDRLITSIGRQPRLRNTLYGTPPAERGELARHAAPVTPIVLTKVDKQRYRHSGNASSNGNNGNSGNNVRARTLDNLET